MMIKKILSNSYLFVFVIVSIFVLIKTDYSFVNLIVLAVGIIVLGLFSLVGGNTKYITNMIKEEIDSNDFNHFSSSYKGIFKGVCWFISLGLSILQIILI